MPYPINATHKLLLEDGSSYLLLEDNTSKLILDEQIALDDPLNAATVNTTTPALTFVGVNQAAARETYEIEIAVNSSSIFSRGSAGNVKFMEPGGDATFNVANITNGGFWDAVGSSVTVETDFVHGNHIKSIKYAPGGGFARTLLGTLSDTGTRVSFYVYFVAFPSATKTFADAIDAPGHGIPGIRITSGGVLQLWNGFTAQIGTNGKTLVTGQWYRISLAYTITSTTVNRFELFVDGASTISVTNATIDVTGSTQFRFGNTQSTAVMDLRTSDHYIDDSSALTDPGDIWVTAKRPNANGTTNNFSTQIGSGGSGYGTGHSPQVNERALSTTNGWSMIGAGSAVTEEYSIEGQSVGDIDISGGTIIDYMGWVSAKSLAGETAQIIVGGASSNITLTTTITIFTKVAGSSTYPAGNTDIGITTDTSLTTVSLYEAGVIVAYIPGQLVLDKTSDLNTGFIDDTAGETTDPRLLLEDGTSVLLLEDNSSKLIINESYPSGDYVSYNVPAGTLTAGPTYYWRVRQKVQNGGSYTAWSEIRSFTISTGTAYTSSLSGSFSASGLIPNRVINRTLPATYSDSGGFTLRAIVQLLPLATFSTSGLLNKLTNRNLGGGTFSASGVLTAAHQRFVSLTATFSTAGLITGRAITRSFAASFSATATFTRVITRTLTATFTTSGNLARRAARALAGTFSTAGTLSRQVGKTLAANFNAAGNIISRAVTRSLAASYTTSGILARLITRPLSGLFSSSGSLAKTPKRNLSATYSDSGLITQRTVGRTLTGSFSTSGNITQRAIARLLIASYSTSGTLNRVTKRALAATFSAAGNLVGSLIHGGTLFTQSFNATFSAAGNLARRPSRNLAGTFSASGVLSRLIIRPLTATFNTSGTLIKLTGRSVVATFSAAGSLTKRAVARTLTATFTTAGSLARLLTRSLSGTFTTTASLAKQMGKAAAGTYTASGVITKRAITRTFGVNYIASGSLARRITRSLAGNFTTSGSLAKTARKTFSATYTTAGNLVSLFIALVTQAYQAVFIDQNGAGQNNLEQRERGEYLDSQDGKPINMGDDEGTPLF